VQIYLILFKQKQKHLINFIRTTCAMRLVRRSRTTQLSHRSKSAKQIYSLVCVIHSANSLLRHCHPVVACHYQRVCVHKSETEAWVEPKTGGVFKPVRIFSENLCKYQCSYPGKEVAVSIGKVEKLSFLLRSSFFFSIKVSIIEVKWYSHYY